MLAILTLSVIWPTPASAGSIVPTRAAVVLGEDGYSLSADFAIDIGSRLEDAITHGVTLYFNFEFVLERPRKYWMNEHVVTHQQSYRLSYSSLTRQYRLTGGSNNFHQNFGSLTESLRVLSRVGALPLGDKEKIKPGESYQAAVRLALDRNQLPKPFQMDAITDREWVVDSKVLRWNFVAPTTPPPSPPAAPATSVSGGFSTTFPLLPATPIAPGASTIPVIPVTLPTPTHPQ